MRGVRHRFDRKWGDFPRTCKDCGFTEHGMERAGPRNGKRIMVSNTAWGPKRPRTRRDRFCRSKEMGFDAVSARRAGGDWVALNLGRGEFMVGAEYAERLLECLVEMFDSEEESEDCQPSHHREPS